MRRNNIADRISSLKYMAENGQVKRYEYYKQLKVLKRLGGNHSMAKAG